MVFSTQSVLPTNQLDPNQGTIGTAFEEQVVRYPEHIAVSDGDLHLTYEELNHQANQLARYLCNHNVQPCDVVALCMERSADFVVVQLAILKCGAAYLPLDPSWPPSEIAFQLQDAQVSAVLTKSRYLAILRDAPSCVICVDKEWDRIRSESPDAIESFIEPETPCYVMYTSGSTGHQKGVVIPHRGVVRLVRDTNYVEITPDDVVAQGSNIAFDASTFEVWGALLNGAQLVLVPEDVVLSVDAYAHFLMHNRISMLFLTTKLFNLYARLHPSAFSTVRAVLFGGEAADAAAVRAVLHAGPPAVLYNVYGPTENTTFTTYYPIEQVPEHATTIPIGYPVAQTSLHVLDAHLQAVAPGEQGELYTGGAGLALGYLNRPALTAERFIEHPLFGRLYRTGDLVRMRPEDNALEFCGRLDAQVKIRGYRIELGEIESILRKHPDVQEVAVVARPDTKGDLSLVACLVANKPLSYEKLHDYLEARVRTQFIPSTFVQMPVLPATSNGGKVDRQHLQHAPLETLGTVLRSGPGRGESRLEEVIAALYTQIMHVEPPDTDHSLLELDSLTCTEFALLLEQHTHVPFKALQMLLLRHPSIRDLALQLAAIQTVAQMTQPSPSPLRSREPGEPKPTFVTEEPRPLLPLIKRRVLAPIDAAAIAYLPNLTVPQRSMVRAWNRDEPLLTHVVETPQGRIGLFSLPVEQGALYSSRDEVLRLSIQALELAHLAGARYAALTGLLPSALEYGMSLARAVAGRRDLPIITTGHATTTSAVAMNIVHFVELAGRDMAHEHLACIGLGSIGRTTLRLLLSILPHDHHPQHLLLCDLYESRLDEVEDEVRADGYAGDVTRLPVKNGTLPDVLYEKATCIVGATNVGGVLNIWRVRPGTLIVDDSGPHCFDTAEAIARMEQQGDILVGEGGEFHVPTAMREVRHTSPLEGITELLQQEEMIALRNEREIMGCLNSGILSFAWGVPTTLGLVDVLTARQHYNALVAHGFTAAHPHLTNYVIPESILQQFRGREYEPTRWREHEQPARDLCLRLVA